MSYWRGKLLYVFLHILLLQLCRSIQITDFPFTLFHRLSLNPIVQLQPLLMYSQVVYNHCSLFTFTFTFIYIYYLATSITDIFASSYLKTKALLLGNIKIKKYNKSKGVNITLKKCSQRRWL